MPKKDLTEDERTMLGYITNNHIPILSLYDYDCFKKLKLPKGFIMGVKGFPDRLVKGKERGYTYLSPKGYEAYREHVKEILIKKRIVNLTFEEFDKNTKQFYYNIKIGTEKFIKSLEKQRNQLMKAVRIFDNIEEPKKKKEVSLV